MTVWRGKYRNLFTSIIIIVSITGILLSILAFHTARGLFLEELRDTFRHDAENRYGAIKRELESHMEMLLSLRAFYLHAEIVSRADFDIFTRNLLAHQPAIQALEWIPRVSDEDRKAYEEAARRDGFPDFRITEREVQGKMIPAGRRKEYFPVYFLAPYKGNEIALGFDLASNPIRKESLELSRDTGKPAASARIILVQETAGQYGFLIYVPIYRKGAPTDSVQNRRENLKGFALGVFRIGDIVEKSLSYLNPAGIDINLYDKSMPEAESFLYHHPSRTRRAATPKDNISSPVGDLRYANTLEIAGRKWLIVCTPAPAYLAERKRSRWQPWGILFGGFLLTGLMSNHLWINDRRARKLSLAYEKLLHETGEREKAEEGLQESEERFRSIFEESPVGMVITGEDYRIQRCNRAFSTMLGYEEEELLGREVESITCPEDREDSSRHSQALLQGKSSYMRLEKRYLRKDGNIMWGNLTAAAIQGRDGKRYGLGVVEDVTANKEAAEKIHRLAYYDGITRLPNRTFFRELVERALTYAKRHGLTMALLLIDLDNFKRVNESLGHDLGDRLLQAVGERLLLCVRSLDYVSRDYPADMTEVLSRLGGDEFALLLHTISDSQDAGKVARRILGRFSEPFRLNDHEVFMRLSIGISLFPEDGGDTDTLIKNADLAMQQAKKAGKNNYQYYSQSMHINALENLNLEIGLHKALERNEFVLFYQPKFDVKKRTISGLEALIRWENSEAGMILPSRFIPLAEETGLIVPMGAWALRAACLQNKAWQDAGFGPLCVSVNFSARQFDQKNLVEMVKGILEDTKLPPRCLEMEITESTIMQDPEKAISTLHEVREMGVKITVDDFGTGFSSLNYLRRIPLDCLKIDRSFVADVISNPGNAAIVKAIIAMAHSLDLKVVAEGVETWEQLSFLEDLSCDEVQGFLLARPLPANGVRSCILAFCWPPKAVAGKNQE